MIYILEYLQMPSIFIWKATQPNKSQQMITYFSGSDWFLEEHEMESRSFSFIDQTCITLTSSKDITSVLVYHAKKLPHNWVGSDILEIITVPYQLIKSDAFGTLEQIGDWMRFISNEESKSFDTDILINEMNQIIVWLHSNAIQSDDKFLIKFNLPSKNHSVHKRYPYKNKNVYNKSYDNRKNVQIPIVSTHS